MAEVAVLRLIAAAFEPQDLATFLIADVADAAAVATPGAVVTRDVPADATADAVAIRVAVVAAAPAAGVKMSEAQTTALNPTQTEAHTDPRLPGTGAPTAEVQTAEVQTSS